jgi:hypothetical protein
MAKEVVLASILLLSFVLLIVTNYVIQRYNLEAHSSAEFEFRNTVTFNGEINNVLIDDDIVVIHTKNTSYVDIFDRGTFILKIAPNCINTIICRFSYITAWGSSTRT